MRAYELLEIEDVEVALDSDSADEDGDQEDDNGDGEGRARLVVDLGRTRRGGARVAVAEKLVRVAVLAVHARGWILNREK